MSEYASNQSILNALDFDKKHIWHPYTSLVNPLPTFHVQSAKGVRIQLSTGESLIDGMASWWSAIHGYNHPQLNQAVTEQIQAMSHVMFGGLTHQPAIDLCQKLIELAPAGLDAVFLADSGSIAVEVAMKMALQYQASRGFNKKTQFIALEQGYHGDTFQAMSICDPVTGMHHLFKDTLTQQFFAPAPAPNTADLEAVTADIQAMQNLLEQQSEKVAAIIVEPIVQGAGGMRFYHPKYLTALSQLADEYNVLLIADEIATGFGRTGTLFACEQAQISPDILCVGKALTGGYLTLAATLTTRKIGEVISQGEAGVFMHGPTFMGNPLACSVANASLKLIEAGNWQQQVPQIESWLLKHLAPCKTLEQVADVRVLGAIGVVEMKQAVNMQAAQAYFVAQGVWIRPFGKLIYLMPPYIIKEAEIKQLANAIKGFIQL